MKINDDKLFDYAYGELPENEIEEMEDYLANNPEALKIVNKYISLKQGIESLPEETIIESLPEETIEEDMPVKNKTSWWVFLKLTFGGGLAGAAIGVIATFIIFGTNIIVPQAAFQVADLKDKELFVNLPYIKNLGKKEFKEFDGNLALKKYWTNKDFFSTENVAGQKNIPFEGLSPKGVWTIEENMSQIFDNNFDSKSIEIKFTDQKNYLKIAWLQPIDMTEEEEEELLEKEVCNDLIEYIIQENTEAICRRAALMLDENIIFIDACKKNENTWQVCYFEDVN